MYCLCVCVCTVYCHRVSTQLQLTDIPIRISTCKTVPLYRAAPIACIRIVCCLQFVRYLTSRFTRRRHVCISWLTNNVTICTAGVCLWCNTSLIATQPRSPAVASKPNGRTSRNTTCILPHSGVRQCRPHPHIRLSAMFLSLTNLEVCHWLSSNSIILVKIR